MVSSLSPLSPSKISFLLGGGIFILEVGGGDATREEDSEGSLREAEVVPGLYSVMEDEGKGKFKGEGAGVNLKLERKVGLVEH